MGTGRPLSDIPAINRFLSYCRIRTVPSKTVLIHAGDVPDVLYYVIKGSVEVLIEDEEGNEMVLAYLNKGQFFGEMSLISGRPRGGDAFIGADTIVIETPRRTMVKLLNSNDEVRAGVDWIFVVRELQRTFAPGASFDALRARRKSRPCTTAEVSIAP